jgi:hypothetical protein
MPLLFTIALAGLFRIARTSMVQAEGKTATATDSTSLLRHIAALATFKNYGRGRMKKTRLHNPSGKKDEAFRVQWAI